MTFSAIPVLARELFWKLFMTRLFIKFHIQCVPFQNLIDENLFSKLVVDLNRGLEFIVFYCQTGFSNHPWDGAQKRLYRALWRSFRPCLCFLQRPFCFPALLFFGVFAIEKVCWSNKRRKENFLFFFLTVPGGLKKAWTATEKSSVPFSPG